MFIAVGVVGALLLIATLVFDDFVDDVIPGFDYLTGPVIGAFLVAFGAFGWFAQEGPSWNTAAALLAAAVGGLIFGYAGFRLTRLLMNQPTDATPSSPVICWASICRPCSATSATSRHRCWSRRQRSRRTDRGNVID